MEQTTDTARECELWVKDHKPAASGAKWGLLNPLDPLSHKKCFAEFGLSAIQPDASWTTCKFDPYIIDLTDGTYTIKYRTEKNGAYFLNIMISGDGPDKHITGSPNDVMAWVGPHKNPPGAGGALYSRHIC